MATTHATLHSTSRWNLSAKLRDYSTLTKPEVNLLILMTTSAGYYLGSGGSFRLAGMFHTLLGTLLVASGTGTLNQCMERAYDAQMRRTADRPLAAGRISPAEAFWFGILTSVLGGLYLLFAVNPLACFLGVSTQLSYLLIYTPLKRVTPLCTLLGAFPGAMPTLIGWAGASATLNREAWFLFAILFLWQFPHFLAIALLYRDDYERAGFRMLPRFDLDGNFTRLEILGFTVVLIATTLVLAPGTSYPWIYGLGVSLAGVFFLYYGAKLGLSPSKVGAGRLIHASVLYLPVVLLMMVLCKR